MSPQALDGFLLIVSNEGFILYSSDSISDYLGLRQVIISYFLGCNFVFVENDLYLYFNILIIIFVFLANYRWT